MASTPATPAIPAERAAVGLVLSVLPARGGADAVARAALWHNLVHRIGHHVPLVFVHDLGRLLADGRPPRLGPDPEVLRAAGVGPGHPLLPLVMGWKALLEELAGSELCHRAPFLDLGPEAVAALVARILEPVLDALGPQAARGHLGQDLPVDARAYDLDDLPGRFAEAGTEAWVRFLRTAMDRHFQVVTSAERIDVDTLRLAGIFAGDVSLAGGLGALDLYRLLDDPAAAEVIHFSLELLPQLDETRRRRGIQQLSVDGVAGVSRRGNPDHLVPTELAYPDEVFAHKYAESQLLYYGREAKPDHERRVHLVLVDGSASMRGARAIFARGLALGLIRRLTATGEEVQLRFFDSRLHEAMRITGHDHRLPYLLAHRPERGRSYARVFQALLHEVGRLRRDAGRQASITFITHGQCHLPVSLVAELASVATLSGIYVLVDGPLALDYLPELHHHWAVTREELAEAHQRRQAALRIVGALAGGDGVRFPASRAREAGR